MRALYAAAAALSVLGLAACSSWIGGSKKADQLKGERISVLTLDNSLKPDERIQDLEVRLPKPYLDSDWPQPGGVPNHANQHLAAAGPLDQLWRVDAGSGTDSEAQLLAQPIVADKSVFVLDAQAHLTAFDSETGRQRWRKSLTPDNEDEGPRGGGVAYADGRLYVTTGFALVYCLDPKDGKEIWHHLVSGPMRAGPTVSGGRVFVITVANETHALAAADGRELWTHTGITEVAGLLGGASPAVEGDIVIAPYSSGELFALQAESGRVIWNESLSPLRRTDPVSSLAHIKGMPVVDRGLVYAVSNSGRMLAIDLRSGARVWEQGIGGTEAPWVAGDFIYVLTTTSEVVCLSRRDGRIRWVTPLPRYEDPKDKEDPIRWSGPVLAGDRLLVGASDRDFWSISPYTGKPLGRVRLGAGVLIAPSIANGTVYVLTEKAQLVALR
jgi:outer membrane protein assembly factor BamB